MEDNSEREVELICSITPVRNEDWILSLSARALLMFVDHAVFLDHASTDNTPLILSALAKEYPGRVTVLREASPVWEEMRHRQRMLDAARALKASHIVTIDADEVLTGDLLPSIRNAVMLCPTPATMQLPWLCLRGSKDSVHTSGVWGTSHASMAFRDAPHLGWNSESRKGYDFHHREPMGRPFMPYWPEKGRQSGLMHLQFVSDRRLRAKQAHYQAVEVLRWPGRETAEQIRKKYSLSVYGAGAPTGKPFDLAACPSAWWEPYAHLMHHYHPDVIPWQEKALKALVGEHGREPFAGLDFFGVC
jgi:hypothetical protein